MLVSKPWPTGGQETSMNNLKISYENLFSEGLLRFVKFKNILDIPCLFFFNVDSYFYNKIIHKNIETC